MRELFVDNLNGKHVLLFTSQLFNYHNLIKAQIESEGAIVHLYDERNYPSSVEKILLRKAHFLMVRKVNRYYAEVAEKEKPFKPDYIFFVSPEAVTPTAMKMLRRAYPQSEFILYMWDSVQNKSVQGILKYFDKKFSFDPNDSKQYGMKLRPLFFASTFSPNEERKTDFKYDVSFIGTVHSDRAEILHEVKEYCDKHGMSYYFYLFVPGKFLLFLRMIFTPGLRRWERSYVHTKPITKEKAAEISSETRCVIDINHPHQTGLTMRTIEMLGLKRKLMTTNKNINQYDFYRPEDQIVIDRRNVKIDVDKLKQKYVDIPDDIYRKYSLRSWVREIFELE